MTNNEYEDAQILHIYRVCRCLLLSLVCVLYTHSSVCVYIQQYIYRSTEESTSAKVEKHVPAHMYTPPTTAVCSTLYLHIIERVVHTTTYTEYIESTPRGTHTALLQEEY